MKSISFSKTLLFSAAFLSASVCAWSQIDIEKTTRGIGNEKPVYVSMSGITGEAAQVIQFDMYVQGFEFTTPDKAQFLISGSNNGNLQAQVTDNINKSVKLSKAYSGASLRRQAHVFVDDFTQVLGRIPICQTKIAFKGETGGGNSEIFVADFDGSNVQAVTHHKSLTVAPAFLHNQLALYYTSYKSNNPDIYSLNLSSGNWRAFSCYKGSNLSPAPSPDGTKVAMILSKDGWTDLYVANSDGSNLKRLTRSRQDESSPCWSPDSNWILYASKDRERRSLSKISPSGGEPQRIPLSLAGNPTEPDWSPDGKYIAFTAQYRSFQVCVVKATGGEAVTLVEGEDPSWAPNSRTLVFGRRQGGQYTLSLLDVPTKQVKTVSRITGSNSQSQPSWAK